MRIQTRKYDYLTKGLYRDSDIFFLKFSANHSSLIEYCLKDEYIKEKEPKQIYDLLNSTLNNDFYHWKDEYAFIEKNKSNDVDYCLFAIDHDNFIKVCIILLNDAHSPIVLYWIDKKEDAPSLGEAIEWIKTNINLSKPIDLSIKYYSFEPNCKTTILYPDTSGEWCSSAIGIVNNHFIEYDNGWYHAGELAESNMMMNLEKVEMMFSIYHNRYLEIRHIENYNHNGINYYIYGKEEITDKNLPSSVIVFFNDSKELFIASAKTNLNKAIDAIKSIYIDKVKKLRYAFLNHWCEQLFVEKTTNNNVDSGSVIYSNEEKFHDCKIVLINRDNNISVESFIGYKEKYPFFINDYIDAITSKKIFTYKPSKIFEKNEQKYTLLNFEANEKQKILCISNDGEPVIKEYSFKNYPKETALAFVEKTL